MNRRTILKSLVGSALACVVPWSRKPVAEPNAHAHPNNRSKKPVALRDFRQGQIGHWNVRTNTVGRYTEFGARQSHIILCVCLGDVIAGHEGEFVTYGGVSCLMETDRDIIPVRRWGFGWSNGCA